MTATISLEELNEQSALLDRVDRKYLIKTSDLPVIWNNLDDCSRVLDINGLTWFGYHSVYYDTPELDCYADAGIGRRRRFKVRTRAYLSSDEHWLEVKTRGPRGTTIKDRLARTGDSGSLSSAERHWIGQTLLFRGITHAPVETLQPTVTTDYSRRTIQICPADAPVSRLTIDVGLTCSTPDDNAESVSFDEYTIVETKGSPRPSRADRQLWTMGHRPLRVSKFGIGVALLNPELPNYKWHRIIKHEFAA